MNSASCRVASTASVLALSLSGVLSLTGVARAQEARDSLSHATRDLAQRVGPAIVALESSRTRLFAGAARGSGFFVSEEGHIVTDLGLVGDRRQVNLRLAGGLRGRARVLGRDPLNGIALLQLEDREQLTARLPGGRITCLGWGESDQLKPAESVFSVGNAYDALAIDGIPAFSRGVVARVGRLRENGYAGLVIETDAAVNPGIYGGPLLDREGRVVGVLSENFSARRFLGVAIPADQVRLSIAALRAGRAPAHGMLGVFVRGSGGEATTQGLEVLKVAPGSPAAKAGLASGDRLLEVDGLRLRDENDLATEMANLPPGAPLTFRYRRGAAEKTVRLLLGEGEPLAVAQAPQPPQRPQPQRPQPQQPQQPQPDRPAAGRPTLGVQVREPESGPGLSVVGVEPKGPADLAGIKAGDTMLMFAGRALDSLDALRDALAGKAPGDLVDVRIERDGWRQDVKVRLGSAGAPSAPAPTGGPGYLGVTLRPQGTHPGALVEGVEPGSPAAAAGLGEGDLIVRADGTPVSATPDLVAVLKRKQAGEAIKLHVIGPRGERDVVVTLGARPGSGAAPTPPTAPTPPPAAARPWLGMALVERAGGLAVDEVNPNGPVAKQLGLKKGDVVASFDGQKLTGLDQLAGILGRMKPGQKVKLVVVRDGWEKEFQLELGTAR